MKALAEEGLAMLGVGGGLYLVGVSKPDVEIGLNIFDAIGGQKRVVGGKSARRTRSETSRCTLSCTCKAG
jgi:hypothetical protein